MSYNVKLPESDLGEFFVFIYEWVNTDLCKRENLALRLPAGASFGGTSPTKYIVNEIIMSLTMDEHAGVSYFAKGQVIIMKKTRLILALVMALAAVGCSEVPEDVKSRTEANNAALSEAQNHSDRTGEVKFNSTDELQADTEKALKEKYSNFIVSDKISINIPSEITKCDFKQVSNYCVNAEKLVGPFFDESLLDGEKPVSMPYDYTKNYTIDTYGFRNIDKKIHFFVWNNGFICFMKPPLFEEQTDGGSQQAIYHIDRNDDLSGSYLLADKEVPVAEHRAQRGYRDNGGTYRGQHPLRQRRRARFRLCRHFRKP